MSFRDHKIDVPKTGELLKKSLTQKCKVKGCGELITPYEGPGSDKYCREHQLQLMEYGGLANGNKIHTLNRVPHCEGCGWVPEEDDRISSIDDPVVKNRVVRSVLDVDHVDGDHFNNDDNLMTLCKICHAIKTIVNQDYLRK
jgi:5-methylcytosine-specific restriction endonuclease McrA